MTVLAVDRDERDGSPRIWAQWFTGDEYGSGSFPLNPAGRVIDYLEPSR